MNLQVEVGVLLQYRKRRFERSAVGCHYLLAVVGEVDCRDRSVECGFFLCLLALYPFSFRSLTLYSFLFCFFALCLLAFCFFTFQPGCFFEGGLFRWIDLDSGEEYRRYS